MAESTWEVNNVFIPKYVPNNLKWYERDGLDNGIYKINRMNFLKILTYILSKEK